MSEKISMDVTKPDLVVRDLGYLKVPDTIRKEYGTVKKYPKPDARLEIEENEVRIVFIFPKDEMDALREV